MAFVMTAGRLEAISQATLPAYPATSSVYFNDQLYVEYAELYRAQPNVRTVVSFLARNIAQLGLHVFHRVSDTDRQRLTDHPLAQLLANPAPPEMRLTRYRLIERLVSDLAIYDNAFWAKVRRDDVGVGALIPIPPHRVTPTGDNWLAADGWLVHGTRGDLELPAEQVVHFRGYNPEDCRTGLSPMETLRELLIEEWEAGRQRQQMWRNGARTSGVIQRPADAPPWSSQAKASFKADWAAQYSGDGPQAGGTPILEDGMTYQAAGLDPKAAQYIEARKLTREEVASAYFIPPPMIGILDNATYSNITEQHKMLYQDTLGPWLTMIAEEIGLQLLPDVDDTGSVYVEFNISEKMRGSFEEQAAAASTSTGRPWMTVNETRARFNLPQIDGGDGLAMPLNVAVGGLASPRDTAPPPEAGNARQELHLKARADDDHVEKTREVLADFFARQSRSVLAKLGGKTRWRRKASVADVFDTDRWNTELADDLHTVNRVLATAAGRKTLKALGLDPARYDAERTLAWLRANAEGIAAGTNALTETQLAGALKDDDPINAVRHLFEVYASARAEQLATTQATAMSSWGSIEAARQTGGDEATKTWETGPNPRAEHARMDGETVGLDDRFSNGADFPGDPTLEEDDRAGCNCSVSIDVPLS